MESYDVVIVGAGLAGLQSARILAGHGLQVALVDRKPSLDVAVHTTGIFVRQSLEDFAIPSAHLGPAIRHVSIYSPAARRLDLESSQDEFRIGRMGPLYERLLKDCRAAGADWLPGTGFVGCEEEGSSTRVRLRIAGQSRSVTTRFLIGADGTNSRVARRLRLSENRRWIVGLEEVYEGRASGGPPRLHCFFDRRVAPGYIAWIADDGDTVHVGVGGYPQRFQPALALDRFRSTAREVVDLSGALIERRAGRIPVGGILPRLANSRGLLLGDAAGAVSPLTAGGLDPCLRLAELAATAAFRFLSSGDVAELAAYDGRRLRKRYRARRMLRAIYDLAGSNVLLEAGCAALRTGPGRRLAERIFFGRGAFDGATELRSRVPLRDLRPGPT
ncbi:MAG: NAD(P)/FAD-dependent oxidoreductase [Planctomycetota bacterium]|nr:MAG: NAD(P)/FAD-dependent oxidoreductase [Planctomycetota bacterium]